MITINASKPRVRGRFRSRLAAVSLATVATVAGTAAMSTPALASTGTAAVANASSNYCQPVGVGYSSAPFSATMYGKACVTGTGNSGTSGSCPGGPQLSTSIAGWASPFVSITSVSGGCYFIPQTNGGEESMWVNIGIQVTDPIEPWSHVNGTVWLRIAMTHNGTQYKQTGATLNLWSFLNLL